MSSHDMENRWVAKFSTKELSASQWSVLSKGLNFAPAPKKIPVQRFVAEVEDGLRYVQEEKATYITQKVVYLLGKATSTIEYYS